MELTPMYAAAICFLGIAGFAVIALAWLSLVRHLWNRKDPKVIASPRPLEDNATWNAIRDTWTEWYSSTGRETPTESALLSWCRTLLLCSGLCLIGILLEVEYGCAVSLDDIWAGFSKSHPAVRLSQTASLKPFQDPAVIGIQQSVPRETERDQAEGE